MLTNKDYCDYDTCVALKELGYNGTVGECSHFGAFYMNGKEIFYDRLYNSELKENECLRVPLYLAQKWLREEKNIIVEVFVDDDSDTPITYNIYKDGECVCHHHGKYWSVKEWSEALSEGIKAAVKILTNKENE